MSTRTVTAMYKGSSVTQREVEDCLSDIAGRLGGVVGRSYSTRDKYTVYTAYHFDSFGLALSFQCEADRTGHGVHTYLT